MRQALHIFRKDTRSLRYPLAMLLTWSAILVAVGAAPSPEGVLAGLWEVRTRVAVTQTSMFVLPALWLYLVAQALHNEPLPGDRQFWLTRPYSRGSLFAAKALFMVTWILMPLAVAQGAILVLRGFPLLPAVPGLAWTGVLILSVGVLPAAALATLTATAARFAAVGLVAPLIFLATNAQGPWGMLEWIRATIGLAGLVTVAGLVLLLQFTSRRTGRSALVALVGVITLVASLPLLPWELAAATQSRLGGPLDGTLAAELNRPDPKSPDNRNLGVRRAHFYFTVTGVVAANRIACNGGEVRILGRSGAPWSSGFLPARPATDELAGICGFTPQVPGELFDATKNPTVTIDATIFVTVFGPEHSTHLAVGQPAIIVPDVGRCAATPSIAIGLSGNEELRRTRLACQMAFRPPPGPVFFTAGSVDQGYLGRAYSYSPFPAEPRILPVHEYGVTLRETEVVTLGTRSPIAHVRTKVQARDVPLQDFEVRLGR